MRHSLMSGSADLADFIVEDGTGVAGANALFSAEDVEKVAEAFGFEAFDDLDTDDKQAAIVRVSAWLSAAFDWLGRRTHGRDQGLAWPRAGVVDAEGNEIADDEMPDELLTALVMALYVDVANPGSLSPTTVFSEQVVREKIGPIDLTYKDASGADAVRSIVWGVNDALRGLVHRLPGDRVCGVGIVWICSTHSLQGALRRCWASVASRSLSLCVRSTPASRGCLMRKKCAMKRASCKARTT